jgi:hypothetical protein
MYLITPQKLSISVEEMQETTTIITTIIIIITILNVVSDNIALETHATLVTLSRQTLFMRLQIVVCGLVVMVITNQEMLVWAITTIAITMVLASVAMLSIHVFQEVFMIL